VKYKKRGPDVNPAPFKIQYPMKNRGKYREIFLSLKSCNQEFLQNF